MDSLTDPNVVWGFQDESARGISTRAARLWSIGKPVRRINSDRVNANIFGFYAVRGSSVAYFPEHSKAPDMCSFLDAVREANGDRKIVMILDNGPVHHTKNVGEHAKELGIELIFLPPYSPQFNPIELIWKSIKRTVSGMFILERCHLIDVVKECFIQETRKISYIASWQTTFFIDHNSKILGS